mmetsp:Transcript_14762/g.63403  ORF Transcript_14762/g.63403 Transcript_14762/m.63403 type:complete len:262 (-) Transcript_14762:636-1421(-)
MACLNAGGPASRLSTIVAAASAAKSPPHELANRRSQLFTSPIATPACVIIAIQTTSRVAAWLKNKGAVCAFETVDARRFWFCVSSSRFTSASRANAVAWNSANSLARKSAIAATTVLVSLNTRSNRTELPAAVKKTKFTTGISALVAAKRVSRSPAPPACRLLAHVAPATTHSRRGSTLVFDASANAPPDASATVAARSDRLRMVFFFFVKIFSSKSKSSTAKKRNRGFVKRPSAAPSATPNSTAAATESTGANNAFRISP